MRSNSRTGSNCRRSRCSSGQRVCRFPTRAILRETCWIWTIYGARAIGRARLIIKPNTAPRLSGNAGNPACNPERAQLAFNSRFALTAAGGNFDISPAAGRARFYRRPISALAVTIGRLTNLARPERKRSRIPRSRLLQRNAQRLRLPAFPGFSRI